MKNKTIPIIAVMMLVFINITGCTQKNTVNENTVQTTENTTIPYTESIEINTETEREEPTEPQSKQEDTLQNWDNLTYGETVLMRQAQADKVCIVVEPSVLRKYHSYYYIPEDEDQKWLQNYMNTLPSEGEFDIEQLYKMKEKGWKIAYQDKCFMVFDGGYLEYSYLNDAGDLVEYIVEAPKLCDYIQAMLQEKLDYHSFNPANIENIVSAKLDVQSMNTGKKFYSQTITDEETLQLFEDWFSNAEYIYGGAECGNHDACLELTLDDGKVVNLSVATDSCSNFGINGIYYDYRPTSSWDNKDFFECFDEIPWDWYYGYTESIEQKPR